MKRTPILLTLVLLVAVIAGLTLPKSQSVNAQLPANVPIGTIIAYAGDLSTVDARNELEKQGWLICDGAPLRNRTPTGGTTPYTNLYGVIRENFGDGRGEPPTPGGIEPKVGDFNLPDMRGRFLRGIDMGVGRDDDVAGRQPMRQGGRNGDAVGSIEPAATARPGTMPFKTNIVGPHTHKDPTWNGQPGPYEVAIDRGPGGVDFVPSADTSENGRHDHTIEVGGDKETRPENINIYWIIKYR